MNALPCLLLCLAALPLARAAPVFAERFESNTPRSLHGGAAVVPAQPPRPEGTENQVLELGKTGGHAAYPDSGEGSPLDFRLGDTVTLEAWVRLDAIGNDQNLYVVGKGRTGRPGFLAENQNYALRVRGAEGMACVSFLFRSAANDSRPGDFHRWTSDLGFKPGPHWHHLVTQYTFGKPESMRGWIDGQSVPGRWDMGGATDAAPLSDDDELWIGSALGGSLGNTFKGAIDDVFIHRSPLAEADLKSRTAGLSFAPLAKAKAAVEDAKAAKGPPVLLQPVRVAPGAVAVDIHEDVGGTAAWPGKLDAPLVQTTAESLALFALPRKYDDWGIREDWKGTLLVRMALNAILLPVGEYDLVLRGRGGTRLWVDGKVVAETPFLKGSTDGHEPVPDLPVPPALGAQPRGYGDREKVTRLVVGKANPSVVLETLVGGPRFRHEPGETLVAMRPVGTTDFVLISANPCAPSLRADTWPSLRTRILDEVARQDDARRRQHAATRDAYWQKRQAFAREWVAKNPAPLAPPAGAGNPVDFFIDRKIEQARARSSSTSAPAFAEMASVQALLSDQCNRCHGEKEKGGLRLDTREHALKGGDTGAALVAGDPQKSLLIERVKLPADHEERMPPKGDRLTSAQITVLERWITAGAPYAEAGVATDVKTTPVLGDAAFLRRATLDIIGLFPTPAEIRAFRTDPSPDKRARAIDRLLADARWADAWIPYWQDVLAENPNFVKPSLNNSGPFRWFLEEALRDGKPVDRWVTELVMMRGSVHAGGSAGFGMAAENDAPYAHKGTILGSAFLGAEMKCARCHDSPYHSTTQKDLFSLAALLDRKPVSVPKTSTVSAAFFEKTKGRESLIKVTLPVGKPVPPVWPFEKLARAADCAPLAENPRDTREQLAAILTAPPNTRFAEMLVNRIWKRLLGSGLVEPADDWEGNDPSHPELLTWLAREFVAHGYDVKHVQRQILNSAAYQREAVADANPREPAKRFFASPDRRRLSAEQVVDGLIAATGIDPRGELLSFDPEALRPAETMNNLGLPRRAWQFTSLSNERDRPSLAMPRNQAVISVMEIFGWRQSRPEPLTCREESVNLLQPAALANGVFGTWLTRLSDEHAFTALALEAKTPEALVDTLTLALLGRPASAHERDTLASLITPGFDRRITPPAELRPTEPPPPLKITSWSNHLSEEANRIKLEEEVRARAGDAPTPRLRAEWRERLEDVVWALVNAPELVWVP